MVEEIKEIAHILDSLGAEALKGLWFYLGYKIVATLIICSTVIIAILLILRVLTASLNHVSHLGRIARAAGTYLPLTQREVDSICRRLSKPNEQES